MEVTRIEALSYDAGRRNHFFANVTTADVVVGWSEFDAGFGIGGVSGEVPHAENRIVLNGLREHLATIRPDASAPGWLIDVDILKGEAL